MDGRPVWRAVLGCPTRLQSLGSGFRIIPLNWVELWGFEPQTSCMPCKSGNPPASDDIRLYLRIQCTGVLVSACRTLRVGCPIGCPPSPLITICSNAQRPAARHTLGTPSDAPEVRTPPPP